VASDGDFLVFEGNRYSRKGFLYKSFTMSAIVADGRFILQYGSLKKEKYLLFRVNVVWMVHKAPI